MELGPSGAWIPAGIFYENETFYKHKLLWGYYENVCYIRLHYLENIADIGKNMKILVPITLFSKTLLVPLFIELVICLDE